MDHRVLHYDWNWQLFSSPEELWPLISDTNRINLDLNLPAVQKVDLSYDNKEDYLQLAYNTLKSSDAWEEEPYQWERPYRYGVKRRYRNGSLKESKIQVDLFQNDRGTRIRYQIWAVPRNLFTLLTTQLKINFRQRRRLKSLFKNYDYIVRQEKHPYEQEYKKRLIHSNRQRIEAYREKLISTTNETEVVSRLLDYLARAKDIDLQRIAPYALADHWKLPRQKVLNVFLHAAKTGLLNFNWNLHCPHCHTIQHTCRSLSEIHEPIFCKDCNHEFYVNFSRTIELSFRPNPLIRKISNAVYCMTGPQTTPQIVIKQLLKPGEHRYLRLHLEEGEYTLRIKGQMGKAHVKVTEQGKDNVAICLDRFGLNDESVEISPDPNLVFENNISEDKIFILEKKEWPVNAVTAASVTSQQLFRDLFEKEVLRKGEKIAVDEQTLMFTDLLDSTGMYNKEGDEQAVVRVIEHFDILQNAIAKHNGAIVKTIGDSVMAVFSNPYKAFMAFIEAHEIIATDKRFNQRLKLKAGIHHGSCVAVNLNNKIDYFGSTVNIAARLVDFADEDEVIISQPVAMNSDVSELLNGNGWNYISKDVTASLRGFRNEQFSVKRIALEKPALRLVI